jgi:hypothetical protein
MLSDALGKALPNGWEVTLSNEERLQQDIDLTLTLLKDGTEVPSSW